MDTLTGSAQRNDRTELSKATAMEAHGNRLEEICLRLDTIRHRLASATARGYGPVPVSDHEVAGDEKAEAHGQVGRNSLLVDAAFGLINDIDQEVDRLITIV